MLAVVSISKLELAPVLDPEHGPIRVRGPVRILAPDGSLLRETEKVTFCGCARSANHPFCDGTHKQPKA